MEIRRKTPVGNSKLMEESTKTNIVETTARNFHDLQNSRPNSGKPSSRRSQSNTVEIGKGVNLFPNSNFKKVFDSELVHVAPLYVQNP